MSTTLTKHPELLEGEILFCYATENGFVTLGADLRAKLRKGSLVPEDFRPSRGTRREEHFPYFAKIVDLDAETLARLGYA